MSEQTPFTDLGDALLYVTYLATAQIEAVVDRVAESDEEAANDLADLSKSLARITLEACAANGRDPYKYTDGTPPIVTERSRAGYSVTVNLPNQGGDSA